MLMALSPEERLRMACRMHHTARALVLAGIKDRYGELDEARVRGQLFLRMYGNEYTGEELERIEAGIPNLRFDLPSARVD
jgi:hypothetical protein